MLRRVGEFNEIEAHDLSLKMRRSEKTYFFQGEFPHETVKGLRNITYADLFRYQSLDELRGCIITKGKSSQSASCW
jgi:hypothetical protein